MTASHFLHPSREFGLISLPKLWMSKLSLTCAWLSWHYCRSGTELILLPMRITLLLSHPSRVQFPILAKRNSVWMFDINRCSIKLQLNSAPTSLSTFWGFPIPKEIRPAITSFHLNKSIRPQSSIGLRSNCLFRRILAFGPDQLVLSDEIWRHSFSFFVNSSYFSLHLSANLFSVCSLKSPLIVLLWLWLPPPP